MAESGKDRDQDLTLEIDGPKITADKFRDAINAFLNLIDEVATEVSRKPRGVRWIVHVHPGSVRVSFHPEAVEAPAHEIPAILDTIETGINSLESLSERPRHFTDVALKNARRLASIIDAETGELDQVRVWLGNKPNSLSTKTLANVDSIFGTASKDWGSVEGRLSVLSSRRGYKFVVDDPLTDKAINCYFSDEILEQAWRAFGKRVCVTGLIRYRANGDISSVQVDDFEVFPDPEALPGYMEVRGILGGED
jgi:hypothetical protein